jgi:hypothetical protein
MMRVVLLMVLMVAMLVAPGAAQEDICNLNDISITLSTIETLLNDAKALSEMDAVGAFEKLMAIHSEIAVFASGCYGLIFNGEADSVIGPVLFPDGMFRSWFFTGGYGIVELTTVRGNCGDTSMMLFNVSADTATNGVQSLLQTTGCMAVISVYNVQSPWSLAFEPIVP